MSQAAVFNVQDAPHPPSGEILNLITSLSNPQNHTAHKEALALRDQTLSSSPSNYSQTCIQFGRVLGCPSPEHLSPTEVEVWRQKDATSLLQLQHDPVGGWLQLREMAGLLLKNALINPPFDTSNSNRVRMRLLEAETREIQSILCRGICDGRPNVRRVSSSLLASATLSKNGALPLEEWGDSVLLPFLVNCLHSAIPLMEAGQMLPDNVQFGVLGSLQTLSKMLEDDAVAVEKGGGAAFPKVVPCLLKLLQICGEEKVKVNCLESFVYLVQLMPSSLVVTMSQFLGVLSALGNDASANVKKLVCRSIVTLLMSHAEYLQEHMVSISQYMLSATADSNPDVALEACDYWLTFGSLDESCSAPMIEAVSSLFPTLLPTLVKCLIYLPEKQEELIALNEEEEAREETDITRAQDMKPVFHKSKTKGGGADDGENDDDDDEDDIFDDQEWTLRTCAASSIDSLCLVYPNEVFLKNILPALEESLDHSNLWVREAGLLALGAIGFGCGRAMERHMSQIHPFLMKQIKDPVAVPQLKSTACWTLARYANWAVEQTASGIQPDLFKDMMEAVCQAMVNKNRKVQIASLSALGTLVEHSEDLVIPYLEPMFRALVVSLPRYQGRTLTCALEIFGSVADCLGQAVGEGDLPKIYFPPLLELWRIRGKADPWDPTLLPLMESLASITVQIGMSCQPWALETFDGAMSIINTCLMVLSATPDEYGDEEAQPIVCATDVIDGLVDGLKGNFQILVQNSTQYGHHFLTVLRTLTAHEVTEVRMSAFALMGDIAINCPVVIQEGMSELLYEAITCMDPLYPAVCSNAVWAIGEVCVKLQGNPAPLQQFAPEIIQNLLALLSGSTYGEEGGALVGLVENASSTMGRLAKVSPTFVAGDLSRCLMQWCDGMCKISDLGERRDAYEGFILSVQMNPSSIQTASPNILDTMTSILFAIVAWHIPVGNMSTDLLHGKYNFQPFPQPFIELAQLIGEFLHKLKDMLGGEVWAGVTRQLPVNVGTLLRNQYRLE